MSEQASSDKVLNERVVDFLYILLRDKILPGDLETVVQNFVENRDVSTFVAEVVYPPAPDDVANVFSNKGLERYARELAERLHAWLPQNPTKLTPSTG